MKKNILLLASLALIIIIPSIRADIAAPMLPYIFAGNGTIFLIPIILIESAALYYCFKRVYSFQIGFWKPVLVVFVANITSAVMGLIFGFLAIPLAGKENLLLIAAMYPAFLLSAFIEWPIIYLFFKSRIKGAGKETAKLSVLINALSYAFIVISATIFLLLSSR